MKKILVPVDFSEPSVLALSYAIEVAKSFSASITVLHVFKVPQPSGVKLNLPEKMQKDAENKMDILLKKIAVHASGITVKTMIIRGLASEMIVKTAKSKDCDLIIMGTKGATGLKEFFMGSTANSVITDTKKPVLVIPEKCRPEGFDNIVFAVGNDKISGVKEVEPLLWFVKEFGTNLDIIHFGTQEENPDDISENLEFLDELFSYSVTYSFGNENPNIEQRIQDFAKEKDADLICMIRQNKSFWQRLFNGSATAKQTFHSKIPLLILHH